MQFQSNTTMTQILDALFAIYAERVPDVRKITAAMVRKGMVASQSEIINDHIAFRTMGVPNLGIASFEKIFLAHGYQRMEFYHFEAKKWALERFVKVLVQLSKISFCQSTFRQGTK